jgi:tetratricopeptide (TPR) repeat protein
VATAEKIIDQLEHLAFLGDWKGQIQLLEQHGDLAETNGRLSLEMGWAYYQGGDWPRGRACLERAIELEPERPGYRLMLAQILTDQEEWEEAAQLLEQVAALEDSPTLRHTEAYLYHAQGLVEEAERVYLETVQKWPESLRVLEAYACFLVDLGRERDARRVYKQAEQIYLEELNEERDNALCREGFAQILELSGRESEAQMQYRLAEQAYRKAAEANPDDWRALGAYAFYLRRRGQEEEAEGLHRKARVLLMHKTARASK